METGPTKTKRVRRCNFSPDELEILVDEVGAKSGVLFASFSSTITNKLKNSIWENIAEKISATTATKRTAADVRKKWNDYKLQYDSLECCRSQVRKKSQDVRREFRLTGGGPAPASMTTVEEKVMALIPTCQIEGIEGGTESGLASEDIGSSNTVLNESILEASGVHADVPEEIAMVPDEDLDEWTTPVPTPSTDSKKSKMKPIQSKTGASDHMDTIVDIERKKLCQMSTCFGNITHHLKAIREIQERRLSLEERRLDLEERRLWLKKRRGRLSRQKGRRQQ